MIPTITIVGRPNVGKSTLFNVLTKTRDALVANQPGLTRDRKFGQGRVGECDYWLIDTGGLSGEDEVMGQHITQQVLSAVKESDYILFLVDGREGLTAADENIAQTVRRFNTPLYLVVNKTEGLQNELVSAEFHHLGFKNIHAISSAHQQGIYPLMEKVLSDLSPKQTEEQDKDIPDKSIKVAIIGRPNVGKSTLVNRMLGYERVITFDQPGTTRDSIFVPLERDGQLYTLIDTAGVRRRAKVSETVEKFSVIKALQAIGAAHIVIMLLDGSEGMTEQDANLLGTVLESGRGLVIAVNKWDGLEKNHREQVRYHLTRKLHFIDFAKIHFISALHGSNVGNLFSSVKAAWQAAHRHVSTGTLNQVLQKAIIAHPPPLSRGRRIKLRYAHQGGHNPPLFVVHGNQVNSLPESYKRYLINTFRKAFELEGTAVHLEVKQGDNPYKDRKNTLTPRQRKKRQRLMQHVKKKR
ncbi:ribosome biogenesis GTPase Der [Candidatus Parabeggiatoa sp. HSG14]|uniref:ribosome biogenesis GTPase Der n=1 Tax=Candidatus Parabeggiatoa sp. HSG14 TaxID=3055593 RepID=UPI0025A6AB1C|nr:ribosome biogenesis GTPase Der [Thiotrichales bacterium HSG14]